MNRKIAGFIILMIMFLWVQSVIAQNMQEIELEKNFTSITPVFISGHEGDMNFIEGFNFSGDILLSGQNIGTVSGQATLLNPPLNLTERYDQGFAKITNNIPNVGTFEVIVPVTSIGSSTSATQGDVTIAWQGSISNATDALTNMLGLSIGIGNVNFFTGQGTIKEIIQFRFGY